MDKIQYFNLKEARQLLPQVKEITQHYHHQVEGLRKEIEIASAQMRPEIEQLMEQLVENWVEKINHLGVEVKGLWLCDFDSGDGFYYCWHYGEEDIEFFHMYETGFSGRRPISLLED